MVTEYNRNILIRRRMEAEAKAKAPVNVPPATEPVQDAEPVAEEKPARVKKTDAEKLKKGK